MEKNKKYIELISILIAMWALAIADLLVPIKKMYGMDFYMPLANASFGKIIYITLALFTFPFIAYGFKKIIDGTALKSLSMYVAYFFSTITVFLHSSYYYYYQVARRLNQHPELQAILNDFDKIKNVIGTIYFLGLILISAILFIQIAFGKSIYPKWFAVINPIVGMIILSIVSKINFTFYQLIYPIFIPATVLAIMMTVYLVYCWKKQGWNG